MELRVLDAQIKHFLNDIPKFSTCIFRNKLSIVIFYTELYAKSQFFNYNVLFESKLSIVKIRYFLNTIKNYLR